MQKIAFIRAAEKKCMLVVVIVCMRSAVCLHIHQQLKIIKKFREKKIDISRKNKLPALFFQREKNLCVYKRYKVAP